MAGGFPCWRILVLWASVLFLWAVPEFKRFRERVGEIHTLRAEGPSTHICLHKASKAIIGTVSGTQCLYMYTYTSTHADVDIDRYIYIFIYGVYIHIIYLHKYMCVYICT